MACGCLCPCHAGLRVDRCEASALEVGSLAVDQLFGSIPANPNRKCASEAGFAPQMPLAACRRPLVGSSIAQHVAAISHYHGLASVLITLHKVSSACCLQPGWMALARLADALQQLQHRLHAVPPRHEDADVVRAACHAARRCASQELRELQTEPLSPADSQHLSRCIAECAVQQTRNCRHCLLSGRSRCRRPPFIASRKRAACSRACLPSELLQAGG